MGTIIGKDLPLKQIKSVVGEDKKDKVENAAEIDVTEIAPAQKKKK